MKKILLLILVSVIWISCEKASITHTDTPIVEGPDEIFEVGIIAHITNPAGDIISNATIGYNGDEYSNGDNSLFELSATLLGTKGANMVIESDGYLPLITRVFHHKSLDEILVDAKLVELPNPIFISESGEDISIGSTIIAVEESDFNSAANMYFKEETNAITNPYFTQDAALHYLDIGNLFYVSADAPLSSNSKLDVLMASENFNASDKTQVQLYKYDLGSNEWVLSDTPDLDSDNNFNFGISYYTWYALAIPLDTEYREIEVFTDEGLKLNSRQVHLGLGAESIYQATFTTDDSGKAYRFLPNESEMHISISNTIESSFTTSSSNKIGVELELPAYSEMSGKILDCDFQPFEGRVLVVDNGGISKATINNGQISYRTIDQNGDQRLSFFDAQNIKQNEVDLQENEKASGIANMLICSDLMEKAILYNGLEVEEEYDACVVKPKPFETIVVVEQSSDEDMLLMSFTGEERGQFTSLIYQGAADLNLELESTAVVDILWSDNVTGALAGQLFTKNIDTNETVEFSFIGFTE